MLYSIVTVSGYCVLFGYTVYMIINCFLSVHGNTDIGVKVVVIVVIVSWSPSMSSRRRRGRQLHEPTSKKNPSTLLYATTARRRRYHKLALQTLLYEYS